MCLPRAGKLVHKRMNESPACSHFLVAFGHYLGSFQIVASVVARQFRRQAGNLKADRDSSFQLEFKMATSGRKGLTASHTPWSLVVGEMVIKGLQWAAVVGPARVH